MSLSRTFFITSLFCLRVWAANETETPLCLQLLAPGHVAQTESLSLMVTNAAQELARAWSRRHEDLLWVAGETESERIQREIALLRERAIGLVDKFQSPVAQALVTLALSDTNTPTERIAALQILQEIGTRAAGAEQKLFTSHYQWTLDLRTRFASPNSYSQLTLPASCSATYPYPRLFEEQIASRGVDFAIHLEMSRTIRRMMTDRGPLIANQRRLLRAARQVASARLANEARIIRADVTLWFEEAQIALPVEKTPATE